MTEDRHRFWTEGAGSLGKSEQFVEAQGALEAVHANANMGKAQDRGGCRVHPFIRVSPQLWTIDLEGSTLLQLASGRVGGLPAPERRERATKRLRRPSPEIRYLGLRHAGDLALENEAAAMRLKYLEKTRPRELA